MTFSVGYSGTRTPGTALKPIARQTEFFQTIFDTVINFTQIMLQVSFTELNL